jgi:hypothetical protein
MEETKYIEGFNDGFLIATNRPELAQALRSATNQSDIPYFEGFKDGIEERQLEQEHDRLNTLKELRERKGRDKDLER